MNKRPWWRLRRSRRGQRWALVVVLATLIVLVVVARSAYQRIADYPEQPAPGTSDPIEFAVPSGASFPQVLELLVENGVVPEDEATYFKVFVLHHGAARKVTAGPHRFRGDMTPVEVLAELQRKQKVREIRVTLPEGKNILEAAQIIAAAGLSNAADLEQAMRDRELLEQLKVPGETVEGYLFPDTYKFRAEATAEQIVERFVARHHQVYAELRRRYREEAKRFGNGLKWGDAEIVTLASIVEKETGAEHERPVIAGVFLNRMRFHSFKPKLLQTDPTIIYGCTVPKEKSAACKEFKDRIRTKQLRDKDNPYNTYTHEGLPPGPITNPGRAALEAVFAPKKSRFLYFVSRNDGTHKFSKKVEEHERYVELYQRQGVKGDGSAAGAADG